MEMGGKAKTAMEAGRKEAREERKKPKRNRMIRKNG